MDNRTKWIKTRFRLGWAILATGVIAAAVGIFLEIQYTDLPYDPRIITGLGILFAGIGIGNLVRYGAAMKDGQSARRLTIEERDERTVLIRARAGNRAYWVSAAFIYAGLMWASFAANDSLPALTGDALWFFLAASVLIPFVVYITSILMDQRNT